MWRPWLLRLAVSVAVLGALLFVVPAGELVSAMGRVPPLVWVAVLVLFLAGHAVSALKWRLLMNRSDVVPLLWLRAHFAGLVANLALPGLAGGDVVRAGWVMRKVERPEGIAVASIADRVIDSGGLLLLALFGAVWAGRLEQSAIRLIVTAAALGGVGAIGVVVVYQVMRRRGRSIVLANLASSLSLLMAKPGLLAVSLAMSLAVQALFVLLNAWLGLVAGVHTGLGAWFLAWPLAKLAALVPISLAGLGVREAALVALLTPFGAAPAQVMAAGLLWDAALFAGGIVGWIAMQGFASLDPRAHNLEG
jgi:uncharacterized membrane protein YbhN (UPF0104 family)